MDYMVLHKAKLYTIIYISDLGKNALVVVARIPGACVPSFGRRLKPTIQMLPYKLANSRIGSLSLGVRFSSSYSTAAMLL
jgi:hypothetical protein